MRYGHFDDEMREYVVSRPDTPLPWINYLGTQDFIGIVSNTGGGYSFYRDARLRRLTRYRYNNAPADAGARHVYLRDDATGDVWSPAWQPVRVPLDSYECRHGLSYTTIASTCSGVASELTYFVPLGETLEVWHLRLTNLGEASRTLSVFAAAEFCLWDALDDATNFQRNLSTGEVEVADGVVYHKTEYRERRSHFAYFACSEPTSGFDTARDNFLGPYRGWDDPVAVERGACSGSIASGWAPIGAHHVEVTLSPHESRDIVFLLGYFENPQEEKFDPRGSQVIDKRAVREVIERWLTPHTVRRGLTELRRHWSELLATMHVRTPDEHTDRMVNIWNAYQCLVTFNVSRSASLYESGISRGIGFRDSNQDVLGAVHLVPERARTRILDLAATQQENGGAYHQYQPLTKRGNNDIGAGFNDDPLWLVLGVAAYVRETGDLGILEEVVPYDNGEGEATSLLEHLRRSLRYTLDRLGPHGLPLIGRADWNDCLNLNLFLERPGASFQVSSSRPGEIAESVFIGGQFVLAANELAVLVRMRGDVDEAESLRTRAAEMASTVRTHGWDGEWFRRAYDHAGAPVGSEENDEGQIFAEAQGMCIMAGIGLDDGAAARALRSVRRRLKTEHGIALLQPPFSRYHLELGEVSSYPPGYKENGGIFCHANPWIVIAEALMGDGDAAFDDYQRINPSVREHVSDVHRCEPYVYAQMIAGPDAATFGEAKNSWLTGAATWNFVAITQWVLGIRPEVGGLRIDPVLPASWAGFRATRRFRGATYDIVVRKPEGLTGRVIRLVVDGVSVDGTLVAPAPPGSTVLVIATVEVAPESSARSA